MHTNQEISNALKQLLAEVATFGESISEEVADAPVGEGVWTILQEYNHVVLATAPIGKVLMFDKERFLSTNHTEKEEQSYDKFNQDYWALLKASKAKAPARFSDLPEELTLETLVTQWKDLSTKIESGLPNWSESELSRAKLQHPLLGEMTLREMLFFTHIHCGHHLRRMREKARIHSSF